MDIDQETPALSFQSLLNSGSYCCMEREIGLFETDISWNEGRLVWITIHIELPSIEFTHEKRRRTPLFLQLLITPFRALARSEITRLEGLFHPPKELRPPGDSTQLLVAIMGNRQYKRRLPRNDLKEHLTPLFCLDDEPPVLYKGGPDFSAMGEQHKYAEERIS